MFQLYVKHLLVLLMLGSVSTAYATVPENITKSLKSTSIIENRIQVNAPDIAEDGAVVSVSVGEVLIDKPGIRVTNVWIFDHNRSERIAAFKLNPRILPKGLSTRIKMGKSSDIYIVAKLSDGQFISGKKHVKVTIGGCGGGGVADLEDGNNHQLGKASL